MYRPLRVTTIILIAVITVCVISATSCRKEKALSAGGIVQFSDDTLKFDTVFTAAGSFTNITKIYNPQSQEIILSSVQLRNGTSSYFHLNVDGRQGNMITNLKIAPHDSLYVFATVNIDPTDTLTPFFITDELVATLNGKQYSIPFTAYGQNCHYIVRDSIGTNTTWLTDKPYVVIHSLVVGPTSILTIPANCKVYMHQDARIFVFGGLLVNPTKQDSVVFQGDRLDRGYFLRREFPGEWGGIYFVSQSQGVINNAILKNCGGATLYRGYNWTAAIRVDSGATVVIDHSVVKNSISEGLISYQGNVIANNCFFGATATYALAIVQGGYDSIVNCTFANYGTTDLSHSSPGTVAVLNWYSPSQGVYYYGDLNATFRNCIVYGSMDSELVCSALPNAAANLNFDHCLLKPGKIIEPFVHATSCLVSQYPDFKYDPMFKNTGSGDFHLTTSSPALNAGVNVPGLSNKDLDGNNRTEGGSIDMGCYEFKP